jgi:hypothetical protein
MINEMPILGVSIPRGSDILGCGNTMTKTLIKQGKLRTYMIGHRRLIWYEDLVALARSRLDKPGDARRNPAEADAGLRAYRRRLFEQRREQRQTKEKAAADEAAE